MNQYEFCACEGINTPKALTKTFTKTKTPNKEHSRIHQIKVSPIKHFKLFNSETKTQPKDTFCCQCGISAANEDCCVNAAKWLSILYRKPVEQIDFQDMRVQYAV